VREGDHGSVTGGALELGGEGIAPGGDLHDALTAGTTAAKEIEPGVPLQDLAAGEPFVLPVVVFHQGGHGLGLPVRHRQFGGAGGAFERTGVHEWLAAFQQRLDQGPGRHGLRDPFVGERQICAAGVPTGDRPLGGAVANEQDEGG